MKKHTVTFGIIIAALISGSAWIVDFAFGHLLGKGMPTLLIASAVSFYCLKILKQTASKSGKLVLGSLAFLTIVTAASFGSITTLVIAGTISIWALRTLSRYRSVLPAGIDLAFCCFGLVAAFWGVSATGSTVVGLWCFFLLQSLTALIPASFTREQQTITFPKKQGISERFQQAERQAMTGIKHLVPYS